MGHLAHKQCWWKPVEPGLLLEHFAMHACGKDKEKVVLAHDLLVPSVQQCMAQGLAQTSQQSAFNWKGRCHFWVPQIKGKRGKEGRKEAFSQIFASASSSAGTQTFFHKSRVWDTSGLAVALESGTITCCELLLPPTAPSACSTLHAKWLHREQEDNWIIQMTQVATSVLESNDTIACMLFHC